MISILDRIDNDIPIHRKRRTVVIRKEQIIFDLQHQLINGEITVRNYLRVITHHYKTQFQNFEMLASNVDEIDTQIEYEEIRQSLNREDNARLCRVCLTNASDTLLLPCRHTQMCSSCTETINNSESNSCPICRELIEEYLKIYL